MIRLIFQKLTLGRITSVYSIESVADVTDLQVRVHVDAHAHSPDLGDAGGLARAVVPASAGLTVVTSWIPRHFLQAV